MWKKYGVHFHKYVRLASIKGAQSGAVLRALHKSTCNIIMSSARWASVRNDSISGLKQNGGCYASFNFKELCILYTV